MHDIYDNDFDRQFDEAVEAIEKKEHRLIWADKLKHGRWINKDDKEFECSHCGNLETLMSSYCRRCGAKMDEVENG